MWQRQVYLEHGRKLRGLRGFDPDRSGTAQRTSQGDFDANDMHGEGRYQWSDGRSYTGQWRRPGAPTTTGRLRALGAASWRVLRNHMGPSGSMQWTDGRCYEGQFRDGRVPLSTDLSTNFGLLESF